MFIHKVNARTYVPCSNMFRRLIPLYAATSLQTAGRTVVTLSASGTSRRRLHRGRYTTDVLVPAQTRSGLTEAVQSCGVVAML